MLIENLPNSAWCLNFAFFYVVYNIHTSKKADAEFVDMDVVIPGIKGKVFLRGTTIKHLGDIYENGIRKDLERGVCHVYSTGKDWQKFTFYDSWDELILCVTQTPRYLVDFYTSNLF